MASTPGEKEIEGSSQSTWKRDRLALEALLSEEPSAQARYERLAGFERKMCFQWIADAPTPVLREQRICRLARRLWLTSFKPFYELASVMFAELGDLYGAPRLLSHLPPEEQKRALQEQRVLGVDHYRNYDAETRFRLVAPQDRLLDDLLMVYARPCVLTEGIVRWLNLNEWETIQDVIEWFDLPAGDGPPGASPPEPLRVEDPTAEELRPESERHTAPVLDLVVDSGGQRAISASTDGTLRVWDAVKGQSLRVLAGHRGAVRSVALTEDGRWAVSASSDGTLRVWDVGAETSAAGPRAEMAGHEGEVCAVALVEERQEAVSASADGTLRVWHLPSGRESMVLRGHTGRVLDVGVTRDGQRAVSASADGTLRVWDLNTGQTQHVLAGHTGPVRTIALTRDDQRVVSASADGTLRVWNLATGRTRAILLGHSAEVEAVALMPGEHRLVSASADGTLRVWHIAGGLYHILAGHSQAVRGVAVMRQEWGAHLVYLSPGSLVMVKGVAVTGEGAVSASADGTLRMWDLKTGQNLVVFAGGAPFSCCAATPGGETFVAGDEHGQVYFLRSGAG
ncbi:MAG: hypothetical protein M3328_03995 [Chloroflexota bacterium]|nr:hypothetical protein [Chloroflexota bacterium]